MEFVAVTLGVMLLVFLVCGLMELVIRTLEYRKNRGGEGRR